MKKKIIMIVLGISIIVVIGIFFLWLKNKEITSDEAYKTAIQQVGKNDQEIIFKTIKKDKNKKIYEIIINDKEYSYKFEIDTNSGRILKQDKKQFITEKEIKKLVLESTKLEEKEASAMTINLENRKEIMTYIVTFFHKNHKYTYEINALNGEFINNNVERN